MYGNKHMPYVICWKCKRSIEPLERLERDKKKSKTYKITYCPFERCNANIDIEEVTVKLWNQKGYFEDYLP